ncbi:hypothetical protein RJ639_013551 [Escallonia herrerae]|uniref:Transcription factor TFIIB cyclin-like domain-containing protein n=1 Tax=Escallonia herrerae TaxID=1293975 RepID=A0AA88VJF1_9ASTE|nr:hypothetical protein RJ639_013551 [Escallonia herrerae]
MKGTKVERKYKKRREEARQKRKKKKLLLERERLKERVRAEIGDDSDPTILIRRSPISIAAAVIYIVTQLSDDKKPYIKDVAIATGVTEWTIRNSYKDNTWLLVLE